MQAVATEYNTLYNGENAFIEGKEGLALGYKDNYYEILPVERIEVPDEVQLTSEGKDPNFNRAEEKAVKAIQKHSMFIGGKEYNPQIDEAYMLLGKARYYDNRFIPALDAFNFILDKYATSNNVNNAKIWKAKTNIRLNNEEYAIKNLQKMLEEEELEDEVIADANAQIAQAMINLDSIPQSLPYIKLASNYVKDKELKGRYAFIKGQIYNRLAMKDSANLAFDEVIALNRKTSRVYMINAYVAKAKNFDYTKEDKIAFLELLEELEEDRENRPFLDKIYNIQGDYYRNIKNDSMALVYYNKSIQAYKNDQTLQSINYQTLAEMNFDKALYKNAGAYYDSTLTNLVENTRQWRRIKKKRENLDDVIRYEEIAVTNDSILRIASMSDEDRLAYFTSYANTLKQRAIEDSIATAKAANKGGAVATNNEFFRTAGQTTIAKPGGTFYFYNTATVSYGKITFRKNWGDRVLEDNWRRSQRRNTSSLREIDQEVEETAPISQSQLFDPQTYIAQIPTDKVVLDSLTKDRDFAYYQLGLIYKEKFKEYTLAANRLERLLKNQPEDRLVLPAKYNLYKIYGQLENATLQDTYKTDILTNHADSRYAEILRNPNAQLATDESSPEFKYNALYKEFENAQYQNVINTSDEYITTYNGNDIVPKLEMLKATAIGRQQGYEAYKKALNFVALTYPNSEEGKQAQEIYNKTIPALKFNQFVPEEEGTNFKLLYQFVATEAALLPDFKTKLDNAIKNYKYENQMYTSIDYYTENQLFVVIHGFDSKLGAEGFGAILASPTKENAAFKITKPSVGISTENYKIIQIHKNFQDYINPGVNPKATDNPQK